MMRSYRCHGSQDLNIGIVTENYGAILDGYMVYVANLFQNLAKKGHNIYVFAPHYPQFNPTGESHVIRVPSIYSRILPPYRVSKPWAAKKVFHQFFRQLRLDIVHSQIPSLMTYPAGAVAKEIGIPHVATYHTFLERYIAYYAPIVPQVMAGKLAKTYSRSVCSRTDCVIVPSSAIAKLLRGYGIKTKTEYIPHGIDIETFKDADGLSIRRELGLEKSDKVLLYVGRLASEKNIRFLFTVLSRLLKDNALNRLKMIVVGTGRHEAGIKRECCEMGLSEAVIFAGLVKDRSRLSDFYDAADVFVFASVTETFGLVLLEAQACGTPVIAIGEGGVCDVVEDGHGGFLTRLDVEQFTETVRRLLLDPELRREQSCKAREHANRFSLDAMTESLLRVYESLAEAKRTT
jgi:1,2-diacylglycerol 3-alpha-glucosyltransferase